MMKKLRFLVSLHTRENDFQVAQAQSGEDTARKLGIDAEIVFADGCWWNRSASFSNLELFRTQQTWWAISCVSKAIVDTRPISLRILINQC